MIYVYVCMNEGARGLMRVYVCECARVRVRVFVLCVACALVGAKCKQKDE